MLSSTFDGSVKWQASRSRPLSKLSSIAGTAMPVVCGAAVSSGGKCVPAVSCFSEGVRAEAEPSFRRHDVVDDRFIGPFVKVVHKLGALVAEKRVCSNLTGRSMPDTLPNDWGQSWVVK